MEQYIKIFSEALNISNENFSKNLKYNDIPILYSPFFSFPLSNERHSGFLLPSIGSSGESGSVISAPYYKNLAETLFIFQTLHGHFCLACGLT